MFIRLAQAGRTAVRTTLCALERLSDRRDGGLYSSMVRMYISR